MTYNWPSMTHRYFVCAKLMFSKALIVTYGTTFPKEIFLQDSAIKRKKMMYDWLLMTHIYVMWAKVMFSKAFLC